MDADVFVSILNGGGAVTPKQQKNCSQLKDKLFVTKRLEATACSFNSKLAVLVSEPDVQMNERSDMPI